MLGEGFLEKGEGEEMIGWEEREGQFFFLVQGASELFNFLKVLEMGWGREFWIC